MACLDWLDKVSYREDDLKLLFAIKTFYTLSLYETFRKKEEIEEENKKLTQKEVINKEVVTNNEIVYGDIVNGNFLNSEYLNVAPYEKGNISRCRRVIDNKAISDLIRYISGKETKTDICSGFDENRPDEELLRKIVEFFLLTTSFVVESKEKESGTLYLYRKRNEVYYEKNITQARKYVCFDVLSIFYNLRNVAQSYSRFDKLVLENSSEVKIEEEKDLNKEQNAEHAQIDAQEQKPELVQKQEGEQNVEQKPEDGQSGEQEQKLNEGQQPAENPSFGEVGKVDANSEKEDKEPVKSETQKFKNDILSDKTKYPLFSKILDYIIDKEAKQASPNDTCDYEWANKRLTYKVSLRNVDLLEQISYRLQRQRPNRSSDSVKLFERMFDNLAEIEISTYQNELGRQNDIKYEFFSVIRDFLRDLSKPGNEKYKEIFDRIYADS